MTGLRIDCREIVRRGQQVSIRLRDLQCFIAVSRRCHEHCSEYQVVWIFRFEFKGLLHIEVTLLEIALRVPIHRQIPICYCYRKRGDRLLHQRQTFLELAFVNRDLPKAMERNSSRNRISRHVENLVEDNLCFVPIAEMMPVEFTQIPERSWIGWIHAMRL